jgi:hypothetical protein
MDSPLVAMKCPNCGADARANAPCRYCGVDLKPNPQAATAGMQTLVVGALPCPDCNLRNEPSAAHCVQCGCRLVAKCHKCGALAYLRAAHCMACGTALATTNDARAAIIKEASELRSRGDLDRSDSMLAAIAERADAPAEALLELARIRAAQAARLHGDVRFLTLHRRKAQEVVSLAERAAKANPLLAQPAADVIASVAPKQPVQTGPRKLSPLEIVLIIIGGIIFLAIVASR